MGRCSIYRHWFCYSYNSPLFIFKNTRHSQLLILCPAVSPSCCQPPTDREDPLDIRDAGPYNMSSASGASSGYDAQSIFLLRCGTLLIHVLLDQKHTCCLCSYCCSDWQSSQTENYATSVLEVQGVPVAELMLAADVDEMLLAFSWTPVIPIS